MVESLIKNMQSEASTPEGIRYFVPFTEEQRNKIGPRLMRDFQDSVFKSEAVRDRLVNNFLQQRPADFPSSRGIVIKGYGDMRHEIVYSKKKNKTGVLEKLSATSVQILPGLKRPTNYFRFAAVTAQYMADGVTPISFKFECEYPVHQNTVFAVNAITDMGNSIRSASRF